MKPSCEFDQVKEQKRRQRQQKAKSIPGPGDGDQPSPNNRVTYVRGRGALRGRQDILQSLSIAAFKKDK